MSANGKARRPYRKASEYAARAPISQSHSNQHHHINQISQPPTNQFSTNQSSKPPTNQFPTNQLPQQSTNQLPTNQLSHPPTNQFSTNQLSKAPANQLSQPSANQYLRATNVDQSRTNYKQTPTTKHVSQSQTDLGAEVAVLRQKLASLSHKLEHAECEFLQTREYLENQIDVSNDRFHRMNEQYKKLQTSYTALLATNRQLEGKLSKVESLEREKSQMMKEVNELNSKVSESRSALLKTQEENERLRKDCNLAVQLLKCNQGTYQTQKLTELPPDVQDRISSYKMEIQDYNEYINPYGESDSDSDDENQLRPSRNGPTTGRATNLNEEIPVELLAKVLRKPENVHLNLEDSDYINDPQLTSTYKGHYAEKKLIKPEYNNEKRSNNQTSSDPSSSPWEKAPQNAQNTETSSPWELAPSQQRVKQNIEDDNDSAAGAYGAYSVGSKRRYRPPRTFTQQPKPDPLPPTQPKSNDDFKMLPRRPPSPDQLEFRAPLPTNSSHGVASYFSRSSSSKSSPSISSSSSSRKHSPLKVRGKEVAKKEETSSLLNQEDGNSDEEEVMDHINIHNNPTKKYLLKGDVEDYEDAGTLLRMTQDEEEEEEDHNAQEIDLEWDPTLRRSLTNPEVETEEPVEENKDLPEKQEVDIQPQPDLLLPYNNLEKQSDHQQNLASDLEGLLISNTDVNVANEKLQKNLSPAKEDIPSMGNLLTQIMHSKPSVENFLLSTPPPPQAFASASNPLEEGINDQYTDVQKSDVLDLIDIDETITKEEGDKSEIEVLNLDEEPRQRQLNRRRNSLDQAQEFGNVLDEETNV